MQTDCFSLHEQNHFWGYVLWRPAVIVKLHYWMSFIWQFSASEEKQRIEYSQSDTFCIWIHFLLLHSLLFNVHYIVFAHSINVHANGGSSRFILWPRWTLIGLSVLLWIRLRLFGCVGANRILANAVIPTRCWWSIRLLRWLLLDPKCCFILRELISKQIDEMKLDKCTREIMLTLE